MAVVRELQRKHEQELRQVRDRTRRETITQFVRDHSDYMRCVEDDIAVQPDQREKTCVPARNDVTEDDEQKEPICHAQMSLVNRLHDFRLVMSLPVLEGQGSREQPREAECRGDNQSEDTAAGKTEDAKEQEEISQDVRALVNMNESEEPGDDIDQSVEGLNAISQLEEAEYEISQSEEAVAAIRQSEEAEKGISHSEDVDEWIGHSNEVEDEVSKTLMDNCTATENDRISNDVHVFIPVTSLSPDSAEVLLDAMQNFGYQPEITEEQSDGMRDPGNQQESTEEQSDGMRNPGNKPESAEEQSDGMRNPGNQPESNEEQSDGMRNPGNQPEITEAAERKQIADAPNGLVLDCSWCKAHGFGMMACSGCMSKFYCNEICQERDWSLGHQFDCQYYSVD
ncbi:predicted protein [Nematostella vectensis]|uniref:MYND-type domain-containing protein n=1 Tax=Nematostella vectensis TaxID=45351 RepID=A7SVF1_NEMVE|nr:predicted protein [Nematostella vectensis]|eukprot:XP_001624423.1 predicted protein [Nematostella vectensis]